MSRKKTLLITALALCVTAALAAFLLRDSTFIGGARVARDAESVESDSVHALCGLLRLREPKELELRGSPLTLRQGERLRGRFPDCALRWDVPLSSGRFESDTTALSLPAVTEEDLNAFSFFPALETLELPEDTPEELVASLRERAPALRVCRRIRIGEQSCPSDALSLSFEGDVPLEELSDKLALFPALRTVELRDRSCSFAELLPLAEAYPAVAWEAEIELAPGLCVPTDATELTITAEAPVSPAALAEALSLFPALSRIEYRDCDFSDAELIALRERSDAAVVWETEVCGLRFPTDAEEIDVSGCTVAGVEAVEDKLPCFDRLRRVIMCECGIDDETMDALDRRHEDIRFIWTVHFGAFFLRTDATTFIATCFPHGYSFLTNKQVQKLGYCRDLIALDIGHMYYSDVSFLEKLTKLRYLILADTGVDTVEWARQMPELCYLELFLTQVKDLSPLTECRELRHLNLAYTAPNDIAPLCAMPWLERLWMTGARLSDTQRAALRQALPDTELELSLGGSSTGGTWRTRPAYFEMRDVFGVFYMEG